jgi:hypothetical protein
MGLMRWLRRYLLPLMQARAGQRPAKSKPDARGKDDHRAAQ